MTDEIHLPDGFGDASDEMKRDVLLGSRSEALVTAIRDELGRDPGYSSPQLNKIDKAEILLRLREE